MQERPNRWQTLKKPLLAFAVSGILLYLVFRKVEIDAVVTNLRNAKLNWFLAATIAFAFQGLCASWRWHMMQKLTKASTHLFATIRLFFISVALAFIPGGHAVADVVKSAIASKWFGVNLPRLIASAPLDRMLGIIGLGVFCGGALGLAALKGVVNIDDTKQSQMIDLRILFVLIAGGIIGFVILLKWRPQGNHPIFQFYNAFADGFTEVFRSPKIAIPGITLGVVVQCFSAAIYFFCLRSITDVDANWLQMIWVFPVIAAAATAPSVAGLGVREATAIALLTGIFEIPEEDAAAMSFLSVGVNLVWVAFGALLLLVEQLQQKKARMQRTLEKDTKSTISVIIPTLNEADELPETLSRLRKIPEVSEIVVSDGGSEDETPRIAAAHKAKVVVSTEASRGRQIACALKETSSSIILILHSDTWMSQDAGEAILRALKDPSIVAGGFWKRFRDSPWLMKGSRFRCFLRALLFRRVMADQAIFVRRNDLEAIGGFPEVPLMEEFEFCKAIRRRGRITLADSTVATSARRFRKNGILRTYLLMGNVSLRYFLGATPEKLATLYRQSQKK